MPFTHDRQNAKPHVELPSQLLLDSHALLGGEWCATFEAAMLRVKLRRLKVFGVFDGLLLALVHGEKGVAR